MYRLYLPKFSIPIIFIKKVKKINPDNPGISLDIEYKNVLFKI